MMTSFGIETIDPRARNFHLKEFLCDPLSLMKPLNPPLSFVACFYTSSSVSQDRRAEYPPPPGRVIFGTSPVRVLTLFPYCTLSFGRIVSYTI